MSDSTARAEIAQLLRQFAGEIEEWMQRPQRLHHEQWTEDSLLPSLDDEPAGLGDRFRVWCEPKLRVIRSHCLTTGLRDVVLEIKSSLQEAVDYLDALWDYTGIPFSGCYGTWNITPAVASRDYTLGRSTPVDELGKLLREVAAKLALTVEKGIGKKSKEKLTPEAAALKMLEKMKHSEEAKGWSERDWTEFLKCTKHAVSGKKRNGDFVNSTWKFLQEQRECNKSLQQMKAVDQFE